MEFLVALVDACENKETDTELYRLTDLLPTEIVEEVNTMSPVGTLQDSGVDLRDSKALIVRLLRSYLQRATTMSKNIWFRFCCTTKQAADSTSLASRTALFSMMLCLSSGDSATNATMLHTPVVVDEAPYIPDDFTLNFLTCDRVMGVFNMFQRAAAGHFTKYYRIPPFIIVYEGFHPNLQGFLCLNNCIAIRKDIALDCSTACARVARANLIGHEVQHGIFRREMGNFLINTGDHFPPETNPFSLELLNLQQESGERFERRLWGRLPAWYAPRQPSLAEIFANRIVEALSVEDGERGEEPQFPEFTVAEWNQLREVVGERPTQTTNPALGRTIQPPVCFITPQQFM